jgi:membrane-bound lytic murein transglycosylase B
MNRKHYIGVFLTLSLLSIGSMAKDANTYKATDNENVKKFINEYSKTSKYTKKELNVLFSKVDIKEKIKKESKKQSEFVLTWDKYRNRILSDYRIDKGKQFIKDNIKVLKSAENTYSVDRHIITAILGIESNYGKNKGNHRALEALSTMAFEYHPRSSFFKKQIVSMLNRCKKQKQDCLSVNSSWAGAVGYPQFIPTSIDAYAVDFNNNGIIDLNNELDDAIGSVANYLKSHGWKMNDFIAKKVQVEDKRYKKNITKKLKLNTTVEDLKFLNVKNIGNVRGTKKAKLFELYNENSNEVWIGYGNFKSITHYNKSNFYATSVYLLSESLK